MQVAQRLALVIASEPLHRLNYPRQVLHANAQATISRSSSNLWFPGAHSRWFPCRVQRQPVLHDAFDVDVQRVVALDVNAYVKQRQHRALLLDRHRCQSLVGDLANPQTCRMREDSAS